MIGNFLTAVNFQQGALSCLTIIVCHDGPSVRASRALCHLPQQAEPPHLHVRGKPPLGPSSAKQPWRGPKTSRPRLLSLLLFDHVRRWRFQSPLSQLQPKRCREVSIS